MLARPSPRTLSLRRSIPALVRAGMAPPAPRSARAVNTAAPGIPPRSTLAAARAQLRSGNTDAHRRFVSGAEQPSSAAGAAGAAGATGTPPKPKENKGLKISHLFGGIVSVGLLVTIYGLLEWYYSLQIWPQSVRDPLKKAIKAKGHGDIKHADGFFREAVVAARSLTPAEMSGDGTDPRRVPLLMLSGIYVTWAAMLEDAGQTSRAFAVLRDAVAFFGPDPLPPAGETPGARSTTQDDAVWVGGSARELSTDEFHRAIGLCQKLGQLAARMGEMNAPPPFPLFSAEQEPIPALAKPDSSAPARRRGDDGKEAPSAADDEPEVFIAPVPPPLGADTKTWDTAAEVYLSSALTAMLKIGLAAKAETTGAAAADPGAKRDGRVVAGRDLSLPHDGQVTADGEVDTTGRVNRRGLGMTMEALAEVYARHKEYEMAAHLLVQAVTTVIPPDAVNPSLEDRCQAAMLMTGISSYVLEPRATPDSIRISRSWAQKALQLADDAAAEGAWPAGVPSDPVQSLCVRARTAAQYNLGMLAELDKNYASAARFFNAALNTARDASYAEGKRNASEALRRVRAAIDAGK